MPSACEMKKRLTCLTMGKKTSRQKWWVDRCLYSIIILPRIISFLEWFHYIFRNIIKNASNKDFSCLIFRFSWSPIFLPLQTRRNTHIFSIAHYSCQHHAENTLESLSPTVPFIIGSQPVVASHVKNDFSFSEGVSSTTTRDVPRRFRCGSEPFVKSHEQ